MPDEFHYSTKLWFAVHASSMIRDHATGRRCLDDVFRIATIRAGGLQAVVAFTDQDLAERFLQSLGDQEMVLLATRTPDMLIELLESMQDAGYVLVAFDPSPRPVLVPVQTVLRDVRREVG
jgi:hypothetical protein